jgi:hypothetical protein
MVNKVFTDTELRAVLPEQDFADLKALRVLARQFALSRNELARYPNAEKEWLQDKRQVQEEMRKLGIDGLGAERGKLGGEAQRLVDCLGTINTKLELLPSCQAEHHKQVGATAGEIRKLLSGINTRQVREARQRLLQAQVELRILLIDFYGGDSYLVSAASNLIMNPRYPLPRHEPMRWLMHWESAAPEVNADLVDAVELCGKMLVNFYSGCALDGKKLRSFVPTPQPVTAANPA